MESDFRALVLCRQANRLCLLQLATAQSANAKTYRERHGLAVRRRRLSVLQPTYPRGGAPSKRASNRTGSGAHRSNVRMSSPLNDVGALANSGHCSMASQYGVSRLIYLYLSVQRAWAYTPYAPLTSEALARACLPKGGQGR